MNKQIEFTGVLKRYMNGFHRVVPFDPKHERLAAIDLTASNRSINEEIFNDTTKFSRYIDDTRKQLDAKYLVGGYDELRAVYSRSELFDGKDEPRRLHLGTDIWGPEGTQVFSPLGGMIHSLAFNDNFGDYGATIILLHQLDGFPFYTLYGHLSLKDISNISAGKYVSRGEIVGHFGSPNENGHWPPHLHFQIIIDIELKEGDYPGVCKFSEREKYLRNCPDPDLILNMNQFIV